MKGDFDYKEVPKNYLHCVHSSCKRSGECLRFLVTRHADPKIHRIYIVNPTSLTGNNDGCAHFQPDELTCFGWGITHLFDNIPYKKALKIKRILCNGLERNTFYRIQRKERQINPNEIVFIRELFKKEGIEEEPTFDELIYKYNW